MVYIICEDKNCQNNHCTLERISTHGNLDEYEFKRILHFEANRNMQHDLSFCMMRPKCKLNLLQDLCIKTVHTLTFDILNSCFVKNYGIRMLLRPPNYSKVQIEPFLKEERLFLAHYNTIIPPPMQELLIRDLKKYFTHYHTFFLEELSIVKSDPNKLWQYSLLSNNRSALYKRGG